MGVIHMTPNAETVAASILSQYWDDDYFPVDPYKIADSMGISVWEANLPSDVSGMYRRHDGKQEIYLRAQDSPNRQRFTTAHELGHAVDSPEDSFVDRKRDQLAQRGVDKHEIFANKFAAALLMPRYAVHKLARKNWDVTQMANFFGVSNTAMEFRLINLGLNA